MPHHWTGPYENQVTGRAISSNSVSVINEGPPVIKTYIKNLKHMVKRLNYKINDVDQANIDLSLQQNHPEIYKT